MVRSYQFPSRSTLPPQQHVTNEPTFSDRAPSSCYVAHILTMSRCSSDQSNLSLIVFLAPNLVTGFSATRHDIFDVGERRSIISTDSSKNALAQDRDPSVTRYPQGIHRTTAGRAQQRRRAFPCGDAGNRRPSSRITLETMPCHADGKIR